MVGEFPELQGVIGGYLARAQGEPDAVAAAIRDHYKPVGQGDDVPTAPVTVAVSLADKIDSSDRLLRNRHAADGLEGSVRASPRGLGVIAISSRTVCGRVSGVVAGWNDLRSIPDERADRTVSEQLVSTFFADRLKVQQREAGVRHDLIDAVLRWAGRMIWSGCSPA